MKRFRWLITSSLSLAIAIALLLIFSGGAQALMLKMSLEELTDGADSIVVGTVGSSSSHWNADRTNIYTEVVISVEDTLKGPAGKNTITIIVPGGTVGDRWQWVEDTPVFEAGEKVGLFLEELNSAGLAQMGLGAMPQLLAAGPPSSVYGGFQGKLSFTEDKPSTRSKMSLNEFKQNVNLALAGQSIPEEQSPLLITEGTAYQTISSISPSTASAGTNTMVTVSGSGFGTRGANDHLVFYYGTSGSFDYYMASTIVSWSDTQIQAYVPVGIISDTLHPDILYHYSAASGPVAVYKNGEFYGHTPFTVTFGYGQVKWSGTNPTVTYRVNEGGVSGRLAAVQAAANSWSNAGANFSFNYGGTTSATTISENGVSEVFWADLPAGVLGAAQSFGSGSTITECDFALNTDYTWNTGSTCPPGQYDVQSIGTHELGHWLKLLDLYGDKAGYPQDIDKIMYGSGSSGETKRNLHSHDILGIQWIYGSSLTVPTVTNSTGASSITSNSARLNGEITTTGGENPTVHIYWGDNDGGTTPGSWDNDVDLGTKPAGTFYTDISGLSASTDYYYRCYAENSGGGTWAATTESFTTEPVPNTPPEVTNVTASQGSGIVNISYNVSDAEQSSVIISFEYWDGDSWEPCTTTTGEGSQSTGTGKAGTWDAKTDFDEHYMLDAKIRVTADDGQAENNIGSGESSPFTLDTTPPYTSGHAPAPGATGMAIDTNIVVHIQDDGDGVDIATIAMTVEAMPVSPVITGTPADYTLTYDPPDDFAYLQVVDVSVDASDLVDNAMATDSYSFTTEADITPPSAPSPDLMTVSQNPPGTPDSVEGSAGAVEASATVEVWDDAALREETNLIASASANEDGSFSAIDIGDNLYTTVWITAKDAEDNRSDATEMTNDIVAPVVAITSPEDGAVVSSQGTIEGTITEANSVESAQVRIQRASDSQYWTGTDWQVDEAWVVAATSGEAPDFAFSYDSSAIAAEDAYTVAARAIDVASNEGISEDISYTIDTTPPTVAIDAVTTPTNVATQTLTGTMEEGAAVALSANTAATFGDVSYPWATTWSCDVTLVEGSNLITATATDAAGNTATAEATIVLVAVTVTKGDFDGDGHIGLADFVEFAAAYGSSTGDPDYNAAGDFDDDGNIGLADFVEFAAVYGT